jgi:hypothetical protein
MRREINPARFADINPTPSQPQRLRQMTRRTPKPSLSARLIRTRLFAQAPSTSIGNPRMYRLGVFRSRRKPTCAPRLNIAS